MYFLLTGHPPFPEGTIAQRIAKHQSSMPPDIRAERPEVPGELEGICFKMIQKDPKFRYANCTTVADVLDQWIVKHKQEAAARASRSGVDSSIGLDTEATNDRTGSGARRNANEMDTVNNATSDTMGGRSRSGISTSDSGVMLPVSFQNLDSSVGSTIDLEAEIARKLPAAATAPKRSGVATAPAATAPKPKPQTAPTPQTATVSRPQQQPATQPVKKGLGRWTIIVGLAIMFVAAVALGVFLARWLDNN